MKFFLALLLTLFSSVLIAEDYVYGPDSKKQDGVPMGKMHNYTLKDSKNFPGTVRHYSVYVPAQYKGEPANLMVFQDGHTFIRDKGDFRAPVVFDNLIHDKRLPITICIFIDPGHKSDILPEKRGWSPRPANRSFEYDSLGDRYSRFLIEEIIPQVSKEFKLTNDPEKRAIAGTSSGAICAWTVAWERPDYFRKVLSFIGSYTNIRGGHVYPAIIRKTPKKPIRIFLQDGANDVDNAHGNWPLANQQMAKSLAFSKYDYKFVYGTGGHNGRHGGTIMPAALVWLWRTEN